MLFLISAVLGCACVGGAGYGEACASWDAVDETPWCRVRAAGACGAEATFLGSGGHHWSHAPCHGEGKPFDAAAAAAAAAATPRSDPLAAGLSAHWDFEAAPRDGEFEDTSGNGRHARSSAPAAAATAQRVARLRGAGGGGGSGGGNVACGHALSLGALGNSHHLVARNSSGKAGLDLGSSFTLALWLRHTGGEWRAGGWETLLDNGSSGSYNPSFGLRVLSGTLAVDFRGGGVAVAHNYPYGAGGGSNAETARARREVALPGGGVWTHVAVTLDAAAAAAGGGGGAAGQQQLASVYVDGVRVFREDLRVERRCTSPKWESACALVDADPPAGPLWIGQEAPGVLGRGFAGLLDDVRVYGDRALSDGEVQRLHARLRHCSG